MHASGFSMTGAPVSSHPITFLGQKALQIPQDLHHAGIITGVYDFLRFEAFFSAELFDLAVISIFSPRRGHLKALKNCQYCHFD